MDGTVVSDFSSKRGSVRRHDDLLVALFVLEQQMAKGEEPHSSMNLHAMSVPTFNNDNSLEFEDETYGGVFDH